MASHSPAEFASGAGNGPDAAGVAPQHFHPPSPRELRAQAVHRLQIGILGLASMLLLVGLANIIMERARSNDEAERGPAAVSVANPAPAAAQAGDPLADIGVVPDLPDGSPSGAAMAPPRARIAPAPVTGTTQPR
jgi:hypothetical protein